MTMQVDSSPGMEGYLKQKVAGGFYCNATEVTRDAIRRMSAEELRATAWRTAIAKGEAELDRGEGTLCTPDLMESITQSALAAMHSGQAIDPDVIL